MILFFDYIYYRVCKAYTGTIDSNPEGAAFVIVSLMQSFTVFVSFMLLAIITQNKSVFNLPIVVIVTIFFYVFNYIRYIYKEDRSYKVLENKWGKDNNAFIKGVFVLIYILFTSILFIGLAIYLGGKKW